MHISDPIVYGGANWRSDREVIEFHLSVTTHELTALQNEIEPLLEELADFLPVGALRERTLELTSEQAVCDFAANLGLRLQQLAGHEVSLAGTASNAAGDRQCAWFEYEDPTTGEATARLVADLLRCALRQNSTERGHLADAVQQFLVQATAQAMPADSWAILRIARGLGIPTIRLDRPPFDPIVGNFRIRPRSLLKLGQGRRQETVDGTFCVSRCEPLHALIRQRMQILAQLVEAGLPTVMSRSQWCSGAAQTARLAERLGYPLRLLSAERTLTDVIALNSREQVREAAAKMLQHGAGSVLPVPEQHCEHRVLLCAAQSVALFMSKVDGALGNEPLQYQLSCEEPALKALGTRVAALYPVGLMAIHCIRYAGSNDASDWQILDVELAPRLDHFLPPGATLDELAKRFLYWLFPDPNKARIPIVAVTGTNGKTTTVAMLENILSHAGYATGLASSVGSRVGGEIVSHDEEAYALGHIKVLNDRRVEVAVLESTRAAAAGAGLGFSRCTVGVCLNVTEDHLNDGLGTGTLADLTIAKRSIVNLAEQAVVLNADDERCRTMASSLSGRHIAWVTLADPAKLTFATDTCAGVIEHAEQSWLTIQQGQTCTPLLPVSAVPATIQGRAAHNVSNALHAALAAYLLGVEIASIAQGLKTFVQDFTSTPGRMNAMSGFPFALYLDYAHNPAGIAALAAFAAATPVRGRRILCFSCNNENSDETIRSTAAAAAGYFDVYICKNFGKLFGRQPEEGPELLKQGLLSSGVTASQVLCVADELAAIDTTLDLAQPGDLVLIIGGKRHQLIHARLQEFAASRFIE